MLLTKVLLPKMQPVSRLSGASQQLLKIILNRQILSPTQIVRILHKGLANNGTNACFINSGLRFIFETVRCINILKVPWERFVEEVITAQVDLSHFEQSEFIFQVCAIYDELYNLRKQSSIVVNRLRERIDTDMNNSGTAGQCFGDALEFITFMVQQFEELEDLNHQHLSNLRSMWSIVFDKQLFDLQLCTLDDYQDTCNGEFAVLGYVTNPSTKLTETHKLLYTILFKHAHFIFFKQIGKGWIKYDDSTVTYIKSLPVSNALYTLSMFQLK